MIPKKIHYFWFGRGEKPGLAQRCIASWHRIHPDFEIIEWNEDNFDVDAIPFSQEAYAARKWAFVSDYARAKILFEHGGFYMDTDMELRQPLDEFLGSRAVCGFEVRGVPYSAFWAVEPGHILAADIRAYYEDTGRFSEVPNTKIFSELLVTKYGADPRRDSYQQLKHGVELFPSHYFSLDLPKNFVTHHFSGSWHGAWSSEANTYKNFVNTYGILNLLAQIPQGKKEIKNIIYNQKLMTADEILDQVPASYIAKHLWDKVLQKIKLKGKR